MRQIRQPLREPACLATGRPTFVFCATRARIVLSFRFVANGADTPA